MTLATALGAAAGVVAAGAVLELAPLLARARGTRRPGTVRRALGRVGRALGVPPAPLTLRERVEQSGLDISAGEVMALKTGGALAGLLGALPLAAALPGRLGAVAAAAVAGAAFLAPDVWLARRVRARGLAMGGELADVLDLLRVALEAGMPVRRAVAEVGRRHGGELAGELRRAAGRLELGVPRTAVMAALRRRAPHPGVGALVAALERAERHGTPPGEALGALAADARAAAARRAADAAARAAPQVQLVVALLLVPSALLLVAAALVPPLL